MHLFEDRSSGIALIAEAAMVLDKHVGFIGAGQMAEALARGFSDKGIVPADHMHCTDISKARRDLFQEMGAHAYEKAVQVISHLAGMIGRLDL